jgi:hypothetical protein
VTDQSPKIFNCEKIVKKPTDEVPLKTSSKKIFKIEKFSKGGQSQCNRDAMRVDKPKNLLLAFKE